MKSAPAAESLFKTLKAENEPWLGDVFVALPVFERLKAEHSNILYGESGSGKTAMRIELTKQAGENVFTALWTPEPILEEPAAGTALARQGMKQALRTCVETLILQGNLPQRLGEPSNFIISALQWFLQNYLPFAADFYIQNEPRLSQDESQWYRNLLNRSLPPVITEQMGLKDQVGLLFMILRAAKYERLWLMIDGIERWTPRQTRKQVEDLLEAVLSTLVFFDGVPGVTFKFFVPASLKGMLHKTSGVERHRAAEADLIWSAEELQALLEKRLWCALDSKKTSLASLCDGDVFINWLKEYGGTSPRAWLQFTAPLLAEFQRRGKRLNPSETRDFICQHPAPP